MEIKNPSDFIAPNVDVKDGDKITIVDEGAYNTLPTDPNKEVLTFWVVVPNGDKKKLSMNATSQRRCIASWGSESKEWVDKQCRVEIVKQQVFQQIREVIYLHPIDAEEDIPIEEVEENEN